MLCARHTLQYFPHTSSFNSLSGAGSVVNLHPKREETDVPRALFVVSTLYFMSSSGLCFEATKFKKIYMVLLP